MCVAHWFLPSRCLTLYEFCPPCNNTHLPVFQEGGEGELPADLGHCQDHITPTIDVAGEPSGVVLTIGWRDRGGTVGSLLHPDQVRHIPGTAAKSKEGHPLVLTSLRALTTAISRVRFGGDRRIELWAMLAHDFNRLDRNDQQRLRRLSKLGAVPATMYRSLLGAFLIGSEPVQPRMDLVAVELILPLSGTRVNIPRMLSKEETESVGAYFSEQGLESTVNITAEGLTSHTSTELPARRGHVPKVRQTSI